jgi:hypothetical protein
MNSLGFESYHDTLNLYLSKYREVQVFDQVTKTGKDGVTSQSSAPEFNVHHITQLLVHHHQIANTQGLFPPENGDDKSE